MLIVDLLDTNHTQREQNIDPCGLTTLPHWLACVDIHKQTARSDDDDDDDSRDGVGLENSSLHDLWPDALVQARPPPKTSCWAEESGRCRWPKYDGNQAFVCCWVIAGFRQRAIKEISACGVSLENLFSDDPLTWSKNRFFFSRTSWFDNKPWWTLS